MTVNRVKWLKERSITMAYNKVMVVLIERKHNSKGNINMVC